MERQSERELVITRTFDGPARIVFEASTRPELLMQWWAPKSCGMSLVACEADVRVGGRYRFEFGHPQASRPMVFAQLDELLATLGGNDAAPPRVTA